jgi:hypothetical protein
MKHYETLGGTITRTETMAKLTELMRESEDCCYVIAHLHRTESGHKDEQIATGWRAVGQLLARARDVMVSLGMGKLQ